MKRDKDPWSKFFWSDWRGDPELRMCGLAARGLWMEMLSVMAEAEPVGHLVVNGHAVSTEQLASLAGAPIADVELRLLELEKWNVFSRTVRGVIYSRRMVRDAKKSEIARKNGRNGGNPKLRKETASGASDNQNPKPHIPEARSQKPEEEIGGGDARPPIASGDPFAVDRKLLHATGQRVLDEMGVRDDPRWLGNYSRVEAWIAQGADPELDIVPTVTRLMASRRAGSEPPRSLAYFDRAIAESVAARTVALPTVNAIPNEVNDGQRSGRGRSPAQSAHAGLFDAAARAGSRRR